MTGQLGVVLKYVEKEVGKRTLAEWTRDLCVDFDESEHRSFEDYLATELTNRIQDHYRHQDGQLILQFQNER